MGLLSGDFRVHAVDFFAEPIMHYQDRGAFELTCFSTIASEDATTHRFKGHMPSWRNDEPGFARRFGAMLRGK